MPCKKCEKKLSKLATPDTRLDGNRCAVGVNKLLEKRLQKDKDFPFNSHIPPGDDLHTEEGEWHLVFHHFPLVQSREAGGRQTKLRLEAKNNQCKVCKVFLHVNGKYCNSCAYKSGRCHICGKKMVDVSRHVMSLV